MSNYHLNVKTSGIHESAEDSICQIVGPLSLYGRYNTKDMALFQKGFATDKP